VLRCAQQTVRLPPPPRVCRILSSSNIAQKAQNDRRECRAGRCMWQMRDMPPDGPSEARSPTFHVVTRLLARTPFFHTVASTQTTAAFTAAMVAPNRFAKRPVFASAVSFFLPSSFARRSRRRRPSPPSARHAIRCAQYSLPKEQRQALMAQLMRE